MTDKERPKRPAGVELPSASGPLSMYPLEVGEAIEAAMNVPPPPKPKRKGRVKQEQPPQESENLA